MPKRYQRPPSNHRLSHFNATSPARNAKTAPIKLGNAVDAKLAVSLMCSARTSLMTSRATTAGVSTTASAKLKDSARSLATPKSIPVEIVAPEREKPRNGKHRPCTAPMISRLFGVQVVNLVKRAPGSAPLLEYSRDQNQDARGSQCRSDQLEMAE